MNNDCLWCGGEIEDAAELPGFCSTDCIEELQLRAALDASAKWERETI